MTVQWFTQTYSFALLSHGTSKPYDKLPSPRTCLIDNLSAAPRSLSVHKTSASALGPNHVRLKPPPAPSRKKRKKEDTVIAPNTDPDDASAGSKRSTKKAKLGSHNDTDAGSTPTTKPKLGKKKRTNGDKNLSLEVVKTKGKSGGKEAAQAEEGKKKYVAEPVISEDGGGNEAAEDSERDPSSFELDEDDREYVPPVHESLAGVASGSAPPTKKNRKYVPPDETPDQRDSRTIFVGNVSSRAMTTKVRLLPVILLD